MKTRDRLHGRPMFQCFLLPTRSYHNSGRDGVVLLGDYWGEYDRLRNLIDIRTKSSQHLFLEFEWMY